MAPDSIWQILGLVVAVITAVATMIYPKINPLFGYQLIALCVIIGVWCVYSLVTSRNLVDYLPSWLPWQALIFFIIGGMVMTWVILLITPGAGTAEYSLDTLGNTFVIDNSRSMVRLGIVLKNRTSDRFVNYITSTTMTIPGKDPITSEMPARLEVGPGENKIIYGPFYKPEVEGGVEVTFSATTKYGFSGQPFDYVIEEKEIAVVDQKHLDNVTFYSVSKERYKIDQKK